MNFGERSQIKSKIKIIEFLQKEHVGRFSTIDKNGFPFVAPMNFVYLNDVIYIHGFPKGEKYENIKNNSKCGFEVDRELAFLPSYFFEPPTDASLTDTLYVSVVIKGYAELVIDNVEKAYALNALMQKHQNEGGYESLSPEMATVRGVGVIKVKPETMTGKYKLGKYWDAKDKFRIATRIMERALKDPMRTMHLFNISGLGNLDDETTKKLAWIHSSEIISMMGFKNTLEYPGISLVVVEDIDW
jgi:nitroimidazol reductase NimA-like FMN-containing flavoprotein (pyridoxamine 5'-phosphate oxidase superfamily)